RLKRTDGLGIIASVIGPQADGKHARGVCHALQMGPQMLGPLLWCWGHRADARKARFEHPDPFRKKMLRGALGDNRMWIESCQGRIPHTALVRPQLPFPHTFGLSLGVRELLQDLWECGILPPLRFKGLREAYVPQVIMELMGHLMGQHKRQPILSPG